MSIFRKIIDGEIPCKKVHENDEFLAFYDINPRAKIHILAIPKQEFRDFNDMDAALLGRMASFIKEIVAHVGIADSGYRLITNTGAHGMQEVPHFHIHILGGEPLGDIL